MSINDDKFEKIILENGLEVLLIHNPNFKNSSIHLTMDAGDIYSPEEAPGLAHLCEHMLCQSSSKYREINQLINFKSRISADLTFNTMKETMTLNLRLSKNELKNAVDRVVWSLHDPLFEKECIENEIKVIDQEFYLYLNNISWIRNELISQAIDKDFPEHSFLCGNKSTLSVSGIQEKLKEFHSKHFHPDRMKLVIQSQLPIKKQKSIVQLFNIMPRKVSKQFSLITKPVPIKYSEKFAGTIVKYKTNNDANSMHIVLYLPSILHLFKYLPLEYLQEIINAKDGNSIHYKLNGLVNKINFSFENLKRVTVIYIEFELTALGKTKIDEIVEIFYMHIHSQVPDVSIFNSAVNTVQLPLKTEVDKVKWYSNLFWNHSLKDIENMPSNFKFDNTVLEDFLNSIGNIKNWLVLVSTNESDFPNTGKYFSTKYSDPKTIDISINFAQEMDKKLQLQNETKLRMLNKQNSNDIIKSELKQFKSRTMIHKEFENGKYILLFDSLYKEDCEIVLNFYGNMTPEQSVGVVIYWDLFVPFFQKKITEKGIEGVFLFNYKHTMPLKSITIQCKRKNVLQNIESLFDIIKIFKPSEQEIQNSRTELKSFIGDQFKSLNPYFCIYPSFLNFLMNGPTTYEFLKILDTVECKPCLEYYILIESTGCITEYETKAIYEIAKSTGTKQLAQEQNNLKKRYSFKTTDSVNKALMIGYCLDENLDFSKAEACKKLAIGAILKALLLGHFFTHLRSSNAIAYATEIEFIMYLRKPYLLFFVQSTSDLLEVEQISMNFINNLAANIISKTSEEELNQIKENICNSYNTLDFSKKENLKLFFLFAQSLGFYNLNIFQQIQKEVKLISKNELIDYLQIFNLQPIVIYSEPIMA